MNIDAIEQGIVIDHIEAGKALQIYDYLGLQDLGMPVSMIQNCSSRKMGRKDIIKISGHIDLNFDILGFVSPSITVSYIKEGKSLEKRTVKTPEQLIDVISCKNPRCITSVEQELEQIFVLSNSQKGSYRCKYCDTIVSPHKHERGF